MAGGAAARLLDWNAAARIGGALAGGPPIGRRSVITQQFGELVSQAEGLVTGFSGLTIDGPPTRAVPMSRPEWVERNLQGFKLIIDPWAERIIGRRAEGALAPVRRTVLAAQVGALLGYLGRKVLGQYDLFGQAGAEDQLYFVVPNVVEIERRYQLPPRDFRLWLSLHEVTHRAQFGGVPWLRDEMRSMIDGYLGSVDLDARKLLETLRRAVDEARRNPQWRGMGMLFLLMTPEQRDVFRRMQAVMSLLEGHANFVMDRVAPGNVRGAERMRRVIKQRRARRPVVQRALGVELKAKQYDMGEAFVARVVDRVGMLAFNRVWDSPDHLPTLEEIVDPQHWVERVAAA